MKRFTMVLLCIGLNFALGYSEFAEDYCVASYHIGKINALRNDGLIINIAFEFADEYAVPYNPCLGIVPNSLVNATYVLYIDDSANPSMMEMLNTAFSNNYLVAFVFYPVVDTTTFGGGITLECNVLYDIVIDVDMRTP